VQNTLSLNVNTYSLQIDPARQFALVREHIAKIRSKLCWMDSPIKIYVERNLGFEAEHHARDLGSIPGVIFHQDIAAKRIGVLTTDAVKHAMCGLLNSMLREKRVHMAKTIVSRDANGIRTRMREQMEVYSYQFKLAETPFNKDQMSLSGKIGGMRDDVCICLQLAIYWTGLEVVPF
jgi:hypothetical protein